MRRHLGSTAPVLLVLARLARRLLRSALHAPEQVGLVLPVDCILVVLVVVVVDLRGPAPKRLQVELRESSLGCVLVRLHAVKRGRR